MSARIRKHMRGNVIGYLALFFAVSSGVVYAGAPNSVVSGDIVNGEVRTPDLRNEAVNTAKITDDGVRSADVRDDTLAGGGLAAVDLAAGSVGNSELASGSVDGGKVADGSLTRSDIAPIEEWHYVGDPGEPAFQNGWHNYDPAASHSDATYQHVAYAKDQFGNVHIRGLAAGGTVGVNVPIFTLSFTYCPWFFHAFPVISNNALGRVTVEFVQPTCDVYLDAGSNAWVSFEGVSYQEWPLESRTRGASAAGGSRGPGGAVRATR